MAAFRSPATSRLLFLGLCIAVSGCGDPLRGVEYQGTPMLTVEGQVVIMQSMIDLQGEVRVALYWSSVQEHGQQHQQEVTIDTNFPARYQLTLFTPPPDEVIRENGRMPLPVAIGVPLLYEDQDGDGKFDADSDLVLGGAHSALVIYMDGEPPAPEGNDETGSGEDTASAGPESGPPAFHDGYNLVSVQNTNCGTGALGLVIEDSPDVLITVDDAWDDWLDADCDGSLDEWL